MKIYGSSDVSAGMRKSLLEDRWAIGNEKHETSAIPLQNNINNASGWKSSVMPPAYRISVSEQGKSLAALPPQNDGEVAAQNSTVQQRAEQRNMSGVKPFRPIRAEDLDWATEYERASLAETMEGIEGGIGSILRNAAKNPLAVGADIQMYLVRQLNAYGHHQKALGHTLANDPYLNSVLDRLGALDPNGENPLVNEIRSLVGMTMRGKDIELFEKDGRRDLVRTYCAYLGIKIGDALKVKDEAGRYFNEKTAAYGFFQEMSRKAKHMEELIAAMLEPEAKEKKDEKAENPTDLSQIIGEKKSGLDDGMKAYRESLRTLHRIVEDKGEGEDGRLSEKEKLEEKKKLIPSVIGYDWERISEQYLKENPELAAIFADNGMR